MALDADEAAAFIERGPCVLVRVERVAGSTPREKGAFMLIGDHGLAGTIGGGQLEFLGVDRARKMLREGEQTSVLDIPLGPDIGQCCGGRVNLAFFRMDDNIRARLLADMRKQAATFPQVLIFGAGHVGLALCRALRGLPFQVHLTDTRASALEQAPDGVACRLSALPEAEVRAAPNGSLFVVATHDHALDFLIVREALGRKVSANGRREYVGMIGSKTKKASFKAWLKRAGEAGLDTEWLVCPIGGGEVGDKRPEVIAALAAAELIRFVAPSMQGQWEQLVDETCF